MSPGVYKWAVVGMLWLVCVLNYADRQAIFSVFTPIKAEMGLSDVQLGVIGSSFMWVYAVALLFAGLVADRVSRKALILGGLAFWSAVTVATAYAETYWQLVTCRALEGLGEAFYFPASMSLIGDYHGRLTRSRAMAIHQSSVYVGTVLGGSVAGYCGEFYGWRTGFYLFGGAGLALAVVLVAALREPPRRAGDDPDPHAAPPTLPDLVRGAGTVLSTPMVLVLLAVFIGTVFVGSILLAWMPTYLLRQFGQSLSRSGLNATLWLQVASMIGVFAGGWLADRWAGRMLGGRMWVQALGLFAGAPLLLVAGRAGSVELFLLLLTAFGVCKGLYDSNTWAALYEVVRPRHRGTAVGLVNGLGWLLGGAPAPVLYAVAAAGSGPGAVISATSAVYLLTGVVLVAGMYVWLPRPADPSKPSEDDPDDRSDDPA
jgi:MFS family permease